MASRADEYRRHAQQCLEMAGTFREREARATLSHMAEVWLRLLYVGSLPGRHAVLTNSARLGDQAISSQHEGFGYLRAAREKIELPVQATALDTSARPSTEPNR